MLPTLLSVVAHLSAATVPIARDNCSRFIAAAVAMGASQEDANIDGPITCGVINAIEAFGNAIAFGPLTEERMN